MAGHSAEPDPPHHTPGSGPLDGGGPAAQHVTMDKHSAGPMAAGTGQEEVERVVIASMVLVEGSVFAQMESIREDALRNNAGKGIHAVLHYQSGWFFYWAEGPAEALREQIRRNQADRRHRSFHRLHLSTGRRLLPSPWSMVMSQSTESAADVGRRIRELRDGVARGHQYSPSSVLRRLSAPLRLPEAAQLADPEAFHRMGVCSASGTRAFDLLAWLGDHYGQPVARRRFAGEFDMDSSSEYVEFMEGGHPCRVIAVARNGLTHGLRRAFLPDWPHFMMLFDGDPRFDDALMARMAAACEGIPSTPLLVGIAPDGATHERMAGAAAAAGLQYLAGATSAEPDLEALANVMREQWRQAGPPPSRIWDVPLAA
ncbi:MAG: hypothetical protein JWQ72_159 [Polaromonas sp.]|nr:hypothetical protein [Polaromonas sp.]